MPESAILEPRVRHLEQEVKAIRTEIHDGFAKMLDKVERLGGDMATVQAQRPQSWDKVLSFITHAVALVSILSGAIIYVSRATSHEDTSELREKMAVLVDRIERSQWQAQVRPTR